MPPMYPLEPKHPEYRKYADYFNQNWRNAHRGAVIRKVFSVRNKELAASYRYRRHKRYGGKAVHRARWLFHGTSRACNAGEKEKRSDKMKWCSKSTCGHCGILKSSFKVSKSNKGMFGRGIYTSQVSSKSDWFVKSLHKKSKFRAMFLCRVISERPRRMSVACQHRTAPGGGYDSIEGLTYAEGGILTEPETVVYRNDAIVPVVVIMYETFASNVTASNVGTTGPFGVTWGTPLPVVGGPAGFFQPKPRPRRSFLSKLFSS